MLSQQKVNDCRHLHFISNDTLLTAWPWTERARGSCSARSLPKPLLGHFELGNL